LFQGCSSIAIKRDALEAIGPLPANAYAWEDWDIGVKFTQIGVTIEFSSQANLLTERPATLTEYWANAVRCHRSHLIGIWHHRAVMFQKPIFGLYECYFYLLSSALVFVLIGAIVLALFQPSAIPLISLWLGLIMIWILGRRAALTTEIAIFTRSSSWLKYTPGLLFLLVMQFAAAMVALVSSWRITPFDYKGPRQLSFK
jgi:GT2 family glycosyltransferase